MVACEPASCESIARRRNRPRAQQMRRALPRRQAEPAEAKSHGTSHCLPLQNTTNGNPVQVWPREQPPRHDSGTRKPAAPTQPWLSPPQRPLTIAPVQRKPCSPTSSAIGITKRNITAPGAPRKSATAATIARPSASSPSRTAQTCWPETATVQRPAPHEIQFQELSRRQPHLRRSALVVNAHGRR